MTICFVFMKPFVWLDAFRFWRCGRPGGWSKCRQHDAEWLQGTTTHHQMDQESAWLLTAFHQRPNVSLEKLISGTQYTSACIQVIADWCLSDFSPSVLFTGDWGRVVTQDKPSSEQALQLMVSLVYGCTMFRSLLKWPGL